MVYISVIYYRITLCAVCSSERFVGFILKRDLFPPDNCYAHDSLIFVRSVSMVSSFFDFVVKYTLILVLVDVAFNEIDSQGRSSAYKHARFLCDAQKQCSASSHYTFSSRML